jgi:hypothetical protein
MGYRRIEQAEGHPCDFLVHFYQLDVGRFGPQSLLLVHWWAWGRYPARPDMPMGQMHIYPRGRILIQRAAFAGCGLERTLINAYPPW